MFVLLRRNKDNKDSRQAEGRKCAAALSQQLLLLLPTQSGLMAPFSRASGQGRPRLVQGLSARAVSVATSFLWTRPHPHLANKSSLPAAAQSLGIRRQGEFEAASPQPPS